MVSTTATVSLSHASPSPAANAPFLSCEASHLLSCCKAAAKLQKVGQFHGLVGSSLFFIPAPAGLTVYVCRAYGSESFAAWLPSGMVSAPFSLPLASVASFLKATKGKGGITFSEGKLLADSGASLAIDHGPSLEDHPDANERLHAEKFPLQSFLAKDLPAGCASFQLSTFLKAAPFCSKDEAKQVLQGVQISSEHGATFATDGYCLHKQAIKAPTGHLPDAWLPAWLAPMVESFLSAAEKKPSAGFSALYESKRDQAFRLCLASDIIVAFRFPSQEGIFPNCQQLIPDRLPFSFAIDSRAFLDSVNDLLQSLKAYDGEHRLTLDFSQLCLGELALSVELQKKIGGSKHFPDLETVGHQSAQCRIMRRDDIPLHPEEDPSWPEFSGTDQDSVMTVWERRAIMLINAGFLKKALEACSKAAPFVSVQWKDGSSPFLLTAGQCQALIMPIQKRR